MKDLMTQREVWSNKRYRLERLVINVILVSFDKREKLTAIPDNEVSRLGNEAIAVT